MENKLNSLEKDQLVEIINIGASHASNALSKMIGKTVMVNVPDGFVDRVEKISSFIGESENTMTVVLLRVLGDISGTAFLVFPPESAMKLAKFLTKSEKNRLALDELDRSALREVGNILLGASLATLSNFLNMNIVQSVPDIATDMLGSVIDSLVAEMGEVSDIILGFKVNLEVLGDDKPKEEDFNLQIFFIFDPKATGKILEKVKDKIHDA